ncbi:MAG TPA: hypothetical protein VNJ52_12285 [Patescibacteria group bacterium]|nr:hypothetical protein [Patescibacteria group bacterium]
MALPSLLKPEPARRRSKTFKFAIGLIVTAIVLASLYWFFLRFHSEDATVNQFLSEVAAGNLQGAYKMWETESNYGYKDFLQDWGPSGYYGPVRSFQIVNNIEPSGGSGVIIIVHLSPFPQFPSENDIAKSQRTKEVRLWVQFSDHSISYAP